MTNSSLLDGFFQNILKGFLHILENFGFVIGSIIFSIIGVTGFKIWNKYFGKEEDPMLFSYKKGTKISEYLLMPFLFYIFGFFMGIIGLTWLSLIAFILDFIIFILYTLLGNLVK